jgi:ATP-dependent Lon protease
MADRDESLDLEELATSDRPLTLPDEVPILPLRDTVLFPNSFMPLAVARESSVRLIDEAISGGKLIGVFTQRDRVGRGTAAGPISIALARQSHPQDVQAADGSLRMIVQGLTR